MTIQLLNNETVGKIAAGEVVERPASVLKELLENAIDAGATRISVSLSGGGVEVIEISDNGHGIPSSQLQLALQRHATSKLSSFDDLDRLSTLGFRGEALPSIAAVSRLELRSRRVSEHIGGRLLAEFGKFGEPEALASPVGTTVIMRDLFANVPARRKFLKTLSTETSYAVRVVENYAQAYPSIALSLTIDGRTEFQTPGDGDYLSAATAVLGEELGRKLLQIPDMDEAMRVPGVRASGWVAHPTFSRSHRQGMILFVNRRWIVSRPLSFALENAFHTLLMVGRHPVAFIDIRVDPDQVDVNVHPTKAEVKFADERSVARAVQRAVHAALVEAPPAMIPGYSFPSGGYAGERDAMLKLLPQPQPNQQFPQVVPRDESPGGIQGSLNNMPLLRVLGQIGATYIIAEGPEGLYLIDQHAAHERIVYERILAQIVAEEVSQQPLLDPVVVELSLEELGVVERSGEELVKIGFDIAPFGSGMVVVRAIPASAPAGDIAATLHRMLGELIEGGAGSDWLDSVAISAACHTSIRAGQHLSLHEMRELVEQLERADNPRACGHGRPTMLQLSQSDLERQFSRR